MICRTPAAFVVRRECPALSCRVWGPMFCFKRPTVLSAGATGWGVFGSCPQAVGLGGSGIWPRFPRAALVSVCSFTPCSPVRTRSSFRLANSGGQGHHHPRGRPGRSLAKIRRSALPPILQDMLYVTSGPGFFTHKKTPPAATRSGRRSRRKSRVLFRHLADTAGGGHPIPAHPSSNTSCTTTKSEGGRWHAQPFFCCFGHPGPVEMAT